MRRRLHLGRIDGPADSATLPFSSQVSSRLANLLDGGIDSDVVTHHAR
jgi:hypothetical protein